MQLFPMTRNELHKWLRKDGLSPKQLCALALRVGDRLSYAEIGEQLGMGADSAFRMVERAREELASVGHNVPDPTPPVSRRIIRMDPFELDTHPGIVAVA